MSYTKGVDIYFTIINRCFSKWKKHIGNLFRNIRVKTVSVTYNQTETEKEKVEGETYYYITKEEFDKLDKLENTYYAGNYYCLSRQEVEQHKENLVYCIVDSEGVRQIKDNYGKENVIVIYIDVSYPQMVERMRKRGDSEEKIEERIDYAFTTNEKERDLAVADYAITNTDLKTQKEILTHLINKLKKGMSYEKEIIL